MSCKVAVLLLVLATICAEFPRSSAYQWTKFPDKETQITYPDQKSLTIKCEWSLSNGDTFNDFKFQRYKNGKQVETTKSIASYYALTTSQTTEPYFTLKIQPASSGYAELTIADVLKQGKNKDDTSVDVMNDNYTYSCVLSVIGSPNKDPKSTTLIVRKKPSITTNLENQYITSEKKVILTCTADGKPTPTIRWDITTISGKSFQTEPQIIIDQFKKDSHVGIYNCTARNLVGTASDALLLQYTECSSGCTSDDKIAIEMTKLSYTSEYGNSGSAKYKELKNTIEKECLSLYERGKKKIFSCVVTGFRSGSVIADLKITYPTGTIEPRKPLEDAIKTGTFAGSDVEKDFVSPTSAPTQPPDKTTDKLTSSPDTGPDSGERTNGETGLGTGAIVAIVVVFSIIFIVIIVVLIVCMLKRRKPAPQKQYKEDGRSKQATAPLKSQPYRDPTYDNVTDDRYPNGGGPPPQYTPSDYAEVRPSHADQDESGMEWDKSVRGDEMWI